MTNGTNSNGEHNGELALFDDILVQIPEEDLPKLKEFYRKYLPYTTHVVSLLNTAIRWKRKCPEKDYLKFMAVNGDWSTDGTLIVLIQSCGRLYKSLKETKMIDWKRNVLFYALLVEHCDTIRKLIFDLKLPIKTITKIDIWWMPKENALALDVECPDDVYIEKLTYKHIPTINEIWPHRFPGSEGYLATLLDMNGGCGVFLRANDKLIAWVLKTHLGALGILQTHNVYKRKGYGSLVTRALSKMIAEEGYNPIGTVVIDNVPSQTMFKGIGYEVLHACEFIQLEEQL